MFIVMFIVVASTGGSFQHVIATCLLSNKLDETCGHAKSLQTAPSTHTYCPYNTLHASSRNALALALPSLEPFACVGAGAAAARDLSGVDVGTGFGSVWEVRTRMKLCRRVCVCLG